jgi:hypothetical protein
MTSPGLEARCAALRQPVVNLVETGILATMKPSEVPALRERIAAVQAILAEGVDGIDEESYLSWHPVAVATLHRMEQAARSGDAADSWRLFKEPTTGFFPLSQSCQGQPGW